MHKCALTHQLLPMFLVALLATRLATSDLRAATPADLTDAVSQRIDKIAAGTPLDSLPQQKIDFHGNLVAWLIRRVPLTGDEEIRYAQSAGNDIAKRHMSRPAPGAANQVLHRLTAELPKRGLPAPSKFTLIVLDDERLTVFTVGGGSLFITQPLLEMLMSNGPRGRDILSFFLAHEIAHVALGHCRNGYQLELLQSELDRKIDIGVDAKWLANTLKTTIAPAGALARFLYTREQEYEADLYALHLCRNAGIDLNQSLNALRYLCLIAHPELATHDDVVLTRVTDQPALAYYLSSKPDPLCRLRRLQMELSGQLENEAGYGLLEFDPDTGMLLPCPNALIEPDERVIVFVHGMEGGPDTFQALMERIAQRSKLGSTRLLSLAWPNDHSLACAGKYLARELSRVCPSHNNVDFVCHSAGGLVVRAYAEIDRGPFHRVIFVGTPHGGSDLAPIRALLETAQFFGDLKLGYPLSLSKVLVDGHGQITHDLQPDSLFLRFLDRHERPAERYAILRGRALKPAQAMLASAALASVRKSAKRRIEEKTESELLRQMAVRLVDSLQMPAEISAGDLAVSVPRATLDGVPFVETMRHHHLTLKSSPDAIDQIMRLLFDGAK